MTFVTMQFARQISVVQLEQSGAKEILRFPQHHMFYEAFFSGFYGKTRTKLKKFRTVQHLFAYLNKLNAGGWMDDEDYDEAWQVVLNLALHLEVPLFE